MGPDDRRDWTGYLAAFHDERAGITEDVLEHARDAAGRTPYDWVVEALPVPGRVLDVACGSAPMHRRLVGWAYVGLDASAAELARARRAGHPVAQADATRLPAPDGSVDAVVVSMALMLVPLAPVLREVGRVLRPGGTVVATVPRSRPVPVRDRLRYARLCAALRRTRFGYPNDRALRAPAAAFAAAGLELVSDETRTFACDLVDEQVAEQLLASLYLPGVPEHRVARGRDVVRRWAGSSISTPIGRLVARRRSC